MEFGAGRMYRQKQSTAEAKASLLGFTEQKELNNWFTAFYKPNDIGMDSSGDYSEENGGNLIYNFYADKIIGTNYGMILSTQDVVLLANKDIKPIILTRYSKSINDKHNNETILETLTYKHNRGLANGIQTGHKIGKYSIVISGRFENGKVIFNLHNFVLGYSYYLGRVNLARLENPKLVRLESHLEFFDDTEDGEEDIGFYRFKVSIEHTQHMIINGEPIEKRVIDKVDVGRYQLYMDSTWPLDDALEDIVKPLDHIFNYD